MPALHSSPHMSVPWLRTNLKSKNYSQLIISFSNLNRKTVQRTVLYTVCTVPRRECWGCPRQFVPSKLTNKLEKLNVSETTNNSLKQPSIIVHGFVDGYAVPLKYAHSQKYIHSHSKPHLDKYMAIPRIND